MRTGTGWGFRCPSVSRTRVWGIPVSVRFVHEWPGGPVGGQGDMRGPGARLCCVHKAGGLPVRDGRVPVPVLGSAQAPRSEPTRDPQDQVLGEDALPQHWGDPSGRHRLCPEPVTGSPVPPRPPAPRPLLSRRRARPCGSCCSGCGRCRASGSRPIGSSRSEYRHRHRHRRGDGLPGGGTHRGGRDTRHLPERGTPGREPDPPSRLFCILLGRGHGEG